MKGMDILHGIKENARTALLPVIVMTADQDSEVDCLTLGAIDFISKPYPKQEIVLARIQRTIELYEDRDLIRWTERDHLTGLYNREFFFHYADQLDAYHPDTPTDAVMLDINHFHMINERYGKAFGDKVLKYVAEKLKNAVSSSDGIVCRIEADTFLIYCPHRTDYREILSNLCEQAETDFRLRARMGIYTGTDRTVDMEVSASEEGEEPTWTE